MSESIVRVPGGGNTFVSLSVNAGADKDIQLVSSFQDQPGRVVGTGPVEIHPIGYEHPMEIVTGYAVGAGMITMNVWAVWGQDAWVAPFEELWNAVDTNRYTNRQNFDGKAPTTLMGVLQAQRAAGSFVIRKYELAANGTKVARVRQYHNCVITDIQAGETVANDSMPQPVTITVMYTHSTVTSSNRTGYDIQNRFMIDQQSWLNNRD